MNAPGNPFIWMPFPRKGHGLSEREHRIADDTASVEFLDRWIGPGAAAE